MTIDTEISIISVIVNSLLAALTGIYVLLTYSLLRQSRVASATAERLSDSQMLISTTPHLELRVMRPAKDSIEVHLTNWGSQPALDLDLWMLTSYDEHEVKAVRRLLDKSTLKKWERSSEGYFYMFERAMHPGLSGTSTWIVPIATPRSRGITCFLQYRTTSGHNLWKLIYLTEPDDPNTRAYKILSSTPEIPRPIERVDHMPLGDRFHFDSTDAAFKEDGFVLNFREPYELAISCGMLRDRNFVGVEDRGNVVRLEQ